MTRWHGDAVDESAEDLVALADLLRDTEPQAVVVSGAKQGLRDFFQARTPNLYFYGDSYARPPDAAMEAIRDGRAFVYLVGAADTVIFAWASCLRVAGSVLVARTPTDHWPHFGAISCEQCDVAIEGAIAIVRRETPAPAPEPLAIVKHPRPRRPLRSVFLGDLGYPSLYRAGVAQGMALHGGWHREIHLRDAPNVIDRQVREMRPDLVWTHMMLWPPVWAQSGIAELLDLGEMWRRDGAIVLIHDGDPREHTRFPHDVSRSVDLALLNHTRPVPEWRVPTLYWPYAALVQESIGDPRPEFRADLAFAGILREGGLYGPRTACVKALVERVGLRLYPEGGGFNNRMQIADVAPSCIAMIGFGRPEAPGWTDTRVFTVPGAGGVLIHDDVRGILTPNFHYVPCERYDLDSIVAALAYARENQTRLRHEAFGFVQAHHTYRERVAEVLGVVYE